MCGDERFILKNNLTAKASLAFILTNKVVRYC